jgi:hypothetical protein
VFLDPLEAASVISIELYDIIIPYFYNFVKSYLLFLVVFLLFFIAALARAAAAAAALPFGVYAYDLPATLGIILSFNLVYVF